MTEKPNGNNASPLQTTRLWRNPIVVVFLFLSLGFLVIVQTRCLDKKKKKKKKRVPPIMGSSKIFTRDSSSSFVFLFFFLFTPPLGCVCVNISPRSPSRPE